MPEKQFPIRSVLLKIEKVVCIAAIAAIVVIALSECIARINGTNITNSAPLLAHFLLLLGLFSGMYTAGKREHLSIVIFQFIKNEKTKQIVVVATAFIAVFICTVLVWSSVSFIKNAITPDFIGFVPNMVFAVAMPLAYGVMALRFAMQFQDKRRFILLLALVLGSMAAFPAIAKIIWGLDTPDSVFNCARNFTDLLYMVQIPLIILLIAAAFMGAPLFTVIGGVALVMIQGSGGEAEAVSNSIYSAFTDSNMIAIPLFTLSGFILSESRAGERLVYCFRSLFSWIPGGMIIATVIICAFFTSFTGASGVTILALGGILFTVLSEKSAYPERFTAGLLTSAGCIGLLFPPSLPIMLAGPIARVNFVHVFLGAIIPGIILVAAMIAFGIVKSVKIKIPLEPFNLRNAASSIIKSAPEIILPFLLIVGYFSGVFNAGDLGAFSVLYVFIVEVIIRRDIKFSDVPKVLYKALPIIGGILSIIAMAKALSYAIIDTQVPDNFTIWMKGAIESKYLFLLLLNIALFAIGCLMDIFSAILVVLPLITPLGAIYGIDPVHLTVIFIINMEVGFLTPPVGINLFLASYRFKKPFTTICRYVLPFLVIQIAVVFLVTYIPVLSTFLTRFF